MFPSEVSKAGVLVSLAHALIADRPAPVGSASAESSETLFNALDGRDLTVLGKRWKIEVFSVIDLAGRRYVQLSVTGPASYMLTVRMTPEARSGHIVPRLLPWLARPGVSGQVLDVPAG